MVNFKKANEEKRKSKWMGEFEDMVVTIQPKYAGKIEWNDAIYMYNSGYSSNTAANRYIKTREDGV